MHFNGTMNAYVQCMYHLNYNIFRLRQCGYFLLLLLLLHISRDYFIYTMNIDIVPFSGKLEEGN